MPELLSDQIRKALDVRDQVTALRQEAMETKQAYDTRMAEINAKLEALRACCPHPHVQQIPDASGGLDSSEVCLYCDLEERSITRKRERANA